MGRTRACPYCGRRFTSRAGRDCCRECERIAREAGATPRAWSAAFDDTVALALMRDFGRWVRLTRVVGCTSEDAKWSVRLLRRHGFQIDGDQHRGYRLTGWTRQRRPNTRPR